MKVFKFGGASIKDASSMRNVAEIIKEHSKGKLLVVISALGKTTNALEEVATHFFKKEKDKASAKIKEVEDAHLKIVNELIPDQKHAVYHDLNKLFSELKSVPDQYQTKDFNLLYDQVVSCGELFSTTIMSHLLQSQGQPAYWLDVRPVIKTDDAFREAKINWKETEKLVNDQVVPLLKDFIVITQGFIGSTPEGSTTTLGREGSDFTAAIFSNLLNAEEQVIWKDVPGVLNANPTLFKNTVKISKLSYEEAVEMTYYGAQVIHPKTIKPLQNKNIPLHVRSFIEKDIPGTIIHGTKLPDNIPPIIVFKRDQVLLQLSTKDFSFMAEENLARVYDDFTRLRIKSNVMQNAAISLSVCIDNIEKKVKELIKDIEPYFNISTDDKVEVLTIRHYNDQIVEELTKGKEILITQKTKDTVQFVYK